MKALRVHPGPRVHLDRLDPASTPGYEDRKEEALARTDHLREELDALQELFYADHRFGLLIVLQGMDTSGKDGVIRHVFSGVNPQGVRVDSFKVPTVEEHDHDFLWRIHPHTPAKGHIAIFNRSHYEDVLAPRVHKTIPHEVWEARYAAITSFEKNLAREGTTVLKFFLHLSRKEQKERLQARLDDPTKRWKFTPSDLHEREFWEDYRQAYEELLSATSSEEAPWFIVPSDHKWFRNLAVSTVLVECLRGLKLAYPPGPSAAGGTKIP